MQSLVRIGKVVVNSFALFMSTNVEPSLPFVDFPCLDEALASHCPHGWEDNCLLPLER